MGKKIIGRREEKSLLKRRLNSKEAEFMAIYGRRRVGKTFLIKYAIANARLSSIEVTGLKDGTQQQQLNIFTRSFEKAFNLAYKLANPISWMEAFDLLTKAIDRLPKKKNFVIFFDELPWLATARSGLLQALDHFWNAEWVNRSNVKLIVCGSAASWIIDNIVNAKGGLHNRLTMSLVIRPFSIRETVEFLDSRAIKMSMMQVLDLYLVMGGIPFYLKAIEKGKSAMQNINQLCFTANGLLFGEFDRLYSSLFKNSEAYTEIIKVLASHPQGMDQQELRGKLKQSASGGTLTKRLIELESAGFIISFVPYGREKKGIYYRIIDEYTLFYLRWIRPVQNRIKLATSQSNYWQSKCQTAQWNSWVGCAFEAFCYKHIDQIAKGLKIHSGFNIGTWRYIPKSKKEKGVQIDLLLDCDDGVINVIEIKYGKKPFRITKQYATQLCDKVDVFEEQLKVKKDIYLTFITVAGLLENAYVDELVSNELTLEELIQ